jgi:hypothetical protein
MAQGRQVADAVFAVGIRKVDMFGRLGGHPDSPKIYRRAYTAARDSRHRRASPPGSTGIVEFDYILRERTATLKSERRRAKAALDRARAQCGTAATIGPAKIDALPVDDKKARRRLYQCPQGCRGVCTSYTHLPHRPDAGNSVCRQGRLSYSAGSGSAGFLRLKNSLVRSLMDSQNT